jgi:hypothetical protein
MAKEKEVKFTHTAISVFQKPDTQEWCLAFVHLNPLTGETKFEKAISCGTSRMEACDKFKVAAVDTGSII